MCLYHWCGLCYSLKLRIIFITLYLLLLYIFIILGVNRPLAREESSSNRIETTRGCVNDRTAPLTAKQSTLHLHRLHEICFISLMKSHENVRIFGFVYDITSSLCALLYISVKTVSIHLKTVYPYLNIYLYILILHSIGYIYKYLLEKLLHKCDLQEKEC